MQREKEMTVAELMELLSHFKPGAKVKMWSDAEGNQIHGLVAYALPEGTQLIEKANEIHLVPSDTDWTRY